MNDNPFKRIHYNAPVTLTFTLAAAAAYGISHLTGGWANTYLFAIYRTSFDALFIIRLFGHAIGHADIGHYFGNFVIILLLGPMLEEKYGGKRLGLMMAVTALATGVMFLIFSTPGTAMLGASGVVFMLMLLASFANMQAGRVPLTFLLVLVVFVGREIVAGASANDNIAYMAHIVGGLCGAVFGFVANRRRLS